MSRAASADVLVTPTNPASRYLNGIVDIFAVATSLANFKSPTVSSPPPEVSAFLNEFAAIRQGAETALQQTLPSIVALQKTLLARSTGLTADAQTAINLAAKLQSDPSDSASKTTLIALLTKMVGTAFDASGHISKVIQPLPAIFDGLADPYSDVLSQATGIAAIVQTDDALTQQYTAEIAQLETQVQQVFKDFQAHYLARATALVVGAAAIPVFGSLVTTGVVATEDHYIDLDLDKLKALQTSINALQQRIDALDAQTVPLLATARFAKMLQFCAASAQSDISLIMSIWTGISSDLTELASQLQRQDMEMATAGSPLILSVFLQEASSICNNIETMITQVQANVTTTSGTIVVGMSAQHVEFAVKAAIGKS